MRRKLFLIITIALIMSVCVGCTSSQDTPSVKMVKALCTNIHLTDPAVTINVEADYSKSHSALIQCNGFSKLSGAEMFDFFVNLEKIDNIAPGKSKILSDGHEYTMRWENSDPTFDGYVFCDNQKYYEAPAAGANPKVVSDGSEEQNQFEQYLKDNNVSLNNTDVQYDQANKRNELFSLQGTASLSDYYNYGYDDVESTHFCLEVMPTGGSYKDKWYIYCNRDSFKAVFEKAKGEDEISVEMVCKITRWEKNQTCMAELFYISY